MYELTQLEAERKGAGKAAIPAARKSTWARAWRYLRANWLLYVIAGPGLAAIFLFTYVPMLGNVIAFEDYSPVTLFFSPWVGLYNFRLLTTSAIFGRLVFNTLFLNILFITAETIAGVGLALLLNELRMKYFKSLAQSLMFLPHFISWPVVGVMLMSFIDYDMGIFNNVLPHLGLDKIPFTNTPAIWPWLLTLIRVWKGAGAGCIVYLAALSGIDPQLYEAAAIDGASRFQRMRTVSLPLLAGTIILLTLMAIGRIFYGDLGMIYALVMRYPELYPTTDVIDTYLLRALSVNSNYGFSAAVGMLQSVVGFILVVGSNWAARRYSASKQEDYALF